jgi:hypothetical protein
MAATNYTPIQLYYSTTASAVPVNTNLLDGELAININDGKLYYKDSGGTVQVIATKGAGTIGGSTTQVQFNDAGALAGSSGMTYNKTTTTLTVSTLNLTNALGATYGGTGQSTYTTGDLLYSSAANTLSKLALGTANYILTVNSAGTNVQWSAPSAISVSTATNLAGGVAGSVPYQSGASTTTFLGIGAADRVMTSSGSAPQWVTALTGLTGVSSSSITNTSLTSGRVVYSGTGGLQTNSANLTFDGTTLTTTGLSNSGTSALVKLVTVGGTSFSGTTVFAPATPAKLYMGTGTVTDTTSAIGATNAVGAVASLAITPIAATNTSVTYTDAATLYIAGAPSAGTNITLTNPYALYIAAGNVYLGSGTANGVAYLNGSKVLTTGSALTFDGTNLGIATIKSTTALNLYAASAYDLNLYTGTTNAARLSSSVYGIFTVGPVGSVPGIGTDYGTLGAWGSAGGGFRIYRGTGAGTSVGYLYGDGSNVYLFASEASTPLIFGVAGSEAMRIGAATGGVGAVGIGYTSLTSVGNNGLAVLGNVGIGTSSPAQTLHVKTSTSATPITLGVLSNATGLPALSFNGAYASSTMAGIYGNGATASNLYYTVPANQNHYFAIADSAKMTLDSSGNLGIGTTALSSAYRLTTDGGRVAFTGNSDGLNLYMRYSSGTAGAFIGSPAANAFAIADSNGTQRMYIDSSGNLGLGVTPSAWGSAYRAIQSYFGGGPFTSNAGSIGLSGNCFNNGTNWIYSSGNPATRYEFGPDGGGTHRWFIAASGTAGNAITFTQAMTLDASGNLLVGTTTAANKRIAAAVGNSTSNTVIYGESGTGFTGGHFVGASATAAGTGWYHFVGQSSGATNNILIFGNGNVQNANNSYAGISDAKLKENIVDATPKLEKLMQVRIRNYNLKGEYEQHKQIGVIAQELEQVFPSMVEESQDKDADGNDLGTTTKSVKYSVFVPMLIKALQELKAEFDAYKASHP